MKILGTLRYWSQGIRLYIGIGTAMVSIEVWVWAQAAFGDNPSLMLIRAEEVYAWLALTMMTLALMIGPLYKLFPKLPAGTAMRDARRLLGVSGAWFAVLHAALAYTSQARGSGADPQTLLVNTPMLLGIAGLIILLALAFTSFDKAFKGMGIWWFRLHRLIYTAGFLALIHAFMVGAHASNIGPLMVLCCVVLLLLILHTCAALQRPKVSEWHIIGLVVAFVLLVIVGNYGVQRYVQRTILLTEHSHQ